MAGAWAFGFGVALGGVYHEHKEMNWLGFFVIRDTALGYTSCASFIWFDIWNGI